MGSTFDAADISSFNRVCLLLNDRRFLFRSASNSCAFAIEFNSASNLRVSAKFSSVEEPSLLEGSILSVQQSTKL